MKKRLLSTLFALYMVLTLLPGTVRAFVDYMNLLTLYVEFIKQ